MYSFVESGTIDLLFWMQAHLAYGTGTRVKISSVLKVNKVYPIVWFLCSYINLL